MGLNININVDTKAFIEKKGKVLTVEMIKAAGCCGGGPIELTTKFEKPEMVERFHEVKIDEITIYVEKAIKAKDDTLTLKLSGLGFLKYVSAEGISRF